MKAVDMTQTQCPKCGAPREVQHQFCPSCGFGYPQTRSAEPTVRPQSSRDRRREIIILALVVAVTAVVYNVVAALVGRDRPIASADSAITPVLQNVIQAGHDFMDHGEFDKAIPQYEQALSMDSLQPDIMVDLGACYHALGENDKADLQFHRALAINPKHPVALFNMGVVSLSVGDTISARNWWTKYLDVATDQQQMQAVREQLSKM
ncbi:MAG: tetratricopeptide repeat protein [candidate division Zixibacteria bacterium]|nr:tetratricopeptide repeat protein [candidate division Zixibacteria bacterium]